VNPRAVMEDTEGARGVFARLAELGISIDEVTQTVLDAGVKLFADSFRELRETIESRRKAMSRTGSARAAGQ
jgi:predicted amino acid-binding ACT domain protein